MSENETVETRGEERDRADRGGHQQRRQTDLWVVDTDGDGKADLFQFDHDGDGKVDLTISRPRRGREPRRGRQGRRRSPAGVMPRVAALDPLIGRPGYEPPRTRMATPMPATISAITRP